MSITRAEFYQNLAAKAVNTLVGGVRTAVEYSTHGVLSVLNAGRKKQAPPVQDEVLFFSATELAEKIRKSEISSEEVVRAYISRIGAVNGVVNAVVEGRYVEALEEARLADQLVRSGTMSQDQLKSQLPLLGVPFTAKEAVLIKGLSSTCGLVSRKGMVAEEDSEAVARMRASGAIPLALTNTSEICMWWETYNKLHGRTNNPYDTTKTVGGSSGGEAALLAAAGSVIGLGTDLGGSIRIPAFFTGIFGHKPSQGVVPHGGQFPPALAEISQYAVVGPMARYSVDLALMLSVLAGPDLTQQLQLFEPIDIRSIKVYYMLDDVGSPGTSITTEVRDSMQNVIDLLSRDGVSVEPVNVEKLKYGFFIWCSYLSMVKEQRILDIMQGEAKDAAGSHEALGEMWRWLRGRSPHTFPVVLNACCQDLLVPLCERPLQALSEMGGRLREEMLQLLQGHALFLYPTFPHAAAHHGQIQANPFTATYCVVFNALGLPVTQCPTGFSPGGMPLGLQIVAAPHSDRLALRMAEHLEGKLGGWVPP